MSEPFATSSLIEPHSVLWGPSHVPLVGTQKAPPCSCPSSLNTISETVHHSQCPICLSKFDSESCVPIGLVCAHVICKGCFCRLYPNGGGQMASQVDLSIGIPNISMLAYLGCPVEQLRLLPTEGSVPVNESNKCGFECIPSMWKLVDIARVIKGHVVSRAIHRKIVSLLTSINPSGQVKVCKAARAVGERALMELTASCSHLSHYHAQQQLWAAIRARACQFMGPAMQEEALKLVLLALEDGSALSRKVLVMFVVQRLAPQFPQASKTSIGHVIQLLYRASCFDVTKRPGDSSLMTLKPEFRNYDSLRREHDAQIVRIALESGIRFTPEQWSSILYGDTTHKPHMQSIIDKLQAPQSFQQMTTEFLVSIQRLTITDDANFLLSIYPHFQALASIDLQNELQLTWNYVHTVLDAVHRVLIGLITFSPSSKSKGNSQRNGNTMTTSTPSGNNHHMNRRVPLVGSMNGNISLSANSNQPLSLANQHQQQSRATMLSCVNNYPGTLSPAPNSPLVSPSDGFNGFFAHGPAQEPLAASGRSFDGNVLFKNGTPIGTSEREKQSQAEKQQIWELLAESQMLRAKMKSLQGRIPEEESRQIQAEANTLEEEAARMMEKVRI